MKRKILPILMVITALTLGPALPAFACGGEACSKSALQCNKGSKCAKKNKKKGGLEEKIFHKAHFYKSNADALGLSEEQVDKIKSLKSEAKKDLIMKKAEIEVLAIDIRALLHDNEVDVKAANDLIDKKYKIKKEKSKNLVQALADIKAVLSAEQHDKVKEIWKAKSKSWSK